MKKILFLIPLIGICSSLLAQAPLVTNVEAEQVPGTKDVEVGFELTGKPGAYTCYIEIWFKSESVQTQWQQVTSILFNGADPNGLQELTFDFYDENGAFVQGKAFTTSASDTMQNKNFIWHAGEDVPDIQTADAQIRIIAFYPKTDEGGTLPDDQQVSGWDGIGDFGGSGGTPGNNGTSPSGDVYVRDYGDPNSYLANYNPSWPNLKDRIREQYGINPFAPSSYFDDASGSQLDVFELSDSIVMDLTSVMPPFGTLLCAVDGDHLIPVMLQ